MLTLMQRRLRQTSMTDFTAPIPDYYSDAFKTSFKHHIEALRPDAFPLNNCTTHGGIIDESGISASILSINETDRIVEVKTGIFFIEIVGGCSCGDEPISINGYCEIMSTIDKTSNEWSFSMLDD